MNLNKFKTEHALRDADIALALRHKYPQITKSVVCMVINSGKYGIRLTDEAEDILLDAFTQDRRQKRAAVNMEAVI